uniref:VRR-NUC domain-containing protein n=1 Tax=Caldanaerobius polysaccharolyticus TaxID=44256 RepID=UPI000552A15D
MQYLKTLDKCFFWKEHGGMYGTVGIPDIICCYHGKFLAFEVKRPVERPTKLQGKTIKDIQEAGGIVYVVNSVDDVKKYFESLNKSLCRKKLKEVVS